MATQSLNLISNTPTNLRTGLSLVRGSVYAVQIITASSLRLRVVWKAGTAPTASTRGKIYRNYETIYVLVPVVTTEPDPWAWPLGLNCWIAVDVCPVDSVGQPIRF